MNSFNPDIIIAAAAMLEMLAIVGGTIAALILLGPRRKVMQAAAGASDMASTEKQFNTMQIVQGEQRALIAELRTEVAEEKRERIENDVAYVRRQREHETELSKAITRNEELSEEIATLREELANERENHAREIAEFKSQLSTMADDLKAEREAREKLEEENEALRDRVRVLESKGKDKVKK